MINLTLTLAQSFSLCRPTLNGSAKLFRRNMKSQDSYPEKKSCIAHHFVLNAAQPEGADTSVCTKFTFCISEIHNAQTNSSEYLAIVYFCIKLAIALHFETVIY